MRYRLSNRLQVHFSLLGKRMILRLAVVPISGLVAAGDAHRKPRLLNLSGTTFIPVDWIRQPPRYQVFWERVSA